MTTSKKRTRMVRPYPIHTLEDALAIATTIQEANAGLPFDRSLLASALGTTPASSSYTLRLNSSAKYGLTLGGYNDETIVLTPRGQSVVAPKTADERRLALLESAMLPEVLGKFYKALDGRHLPEDAYVQNLLQREFGVHSALTAECLSILKANGVLVGILTESENGLVVSTPSHGTQLSAEQAEVSHQMGARTQGQDSDSVVEQDAPPGRIFIGHNGDMESVDYVRSVLDMFEIPYAIADEGPSQGAAATSNMADVMKTCTSAILIAGRDAEGKVDVSSIIYQLGAASVLFGNRILIFKERSAELSVDLGGIVTLEFDRDDYGTWGLSLLRELNGAQVISISV